MIVHCLFEQSGTFKNEFKKLGFDAYDYDILNNYGQTDYVVDLYAEIRGGYEEKESIFDRIMPDDLILAFFPCTRFEDQIIMGFRGNMNQQQKWGNIKKLEYDMGLMSELATNYEIISKLFVICEKRGLRLICENPYSEQHFLHRYWCINPAIIDMDRRDMGDYYKKPTQYWFVNIQPQNNFLFEPIEYNANVNRIEFVKRENFVGNAKDRKEARSMIHPTYANRFIRTYILEEESDGEKTTG